MCMYRVDSKKTPADNWRFGSTHHIETPLSAMTEAAGNIGRVMGWQMRVVIVDHAEQVPEEHQVIWESERAEVAAR